MILRALNLTGLIFLLSFSALLRAQAQDVPDARINPFLPQLPPKEVPAPQVPQESHQEQSRTPYPSQPERYPSETAVQPDIVAPELKITGVVWNSDRPQAIVDGQVVDEGDTVSQVKIVSIEKSVIEIEYMGKMFNITP